MKTRIRNGEIQDVPFILKMILALADFEKLSHDVFATEEKLRQTLFGSNRFAEVLILEEIKENTFNGVGMALYFHNYSTFLAQPGIYLEDLFVLPESRGYGYGRLLLKKLAEIAYERNCGRLDWSVLDWNSDAIRFYKTLGATSLNDWTTFRLSGEALKKLALE